MSEFYFLYSTAVPNPARPEKLSKGIPTIRNKSNAKQVRNVNAVSSKDQLEDYMKHQQFTFLFRDILAIVFRKQF
eukprot:2330900-Amphidinium_carterae.1